jgi:hypothetical protein
MILNLYGISNKDTHIHQTQINVKKTIATFVFVVLISMNSAVQAIPPLPQSGFGATGRPAASWSRSDGLSTDGVQVRITPANYRDVLGSLPDYTDLYYLIIYLFI